MTDYNRRTILHAAGASTLAVAVAGCLGDDDNGDAAAGDDTGDDDGDDDGGADGFEIDPGTEIVFDGLTQGWVGLEPSAIDGEENPTLVLQEGEEYTMGWTDGDGSQHNIEIWDDGGDVVDNLQTDLTADPDDDQFLEFTASTEMAEYVCEPHATTMIADIVVE